MSSGDMFDSSVRSAGDLAGVFEHNGETGYFYLYDLERQEDQRVVGAIRVIAVPHVFDDNDFVIRWNESEEVVGLFIKGDLWAAFEGSGYNQFGGNFEPGVEADIPPTILKAFDQSERSH